VIMRKTRCVECGRPVEHNAKALLVHSEKFHRNKEQGQQRLEEQLEEGQ
jgi:hypothetical protein